MKYKKQYVYGTLLFFCLVFLFLLPLGHDLWYHMYRIGAMAVELKEHPFSIPIRILSDTYNGYGYGAPLYYGDFFLYLPALLVALGLDIVAVYKGLVVAIFLAAFGISYFSAGLIRKDNDCPLLFAYAYTFSVGFGMNLCIRSAIGEVLAMVFLPLVFASFYCLLYKKESKKQYWIYLFLGMSAIALSHMISLLLCGIVLIVWALMEWRIVFLQKKWLDILKAALCMLLSTASFLFPMFEQMLYQKVQTPGNNDYQKQAFLDYGIDWMDYFLPYDIKKALRSLLHLSWDTEFWHPGAIGLLALVLLIFVFCFRVSLSRKEKLVFYSSLGFLLALGIPPIMNIAKEFLSFMQFSWRILPFITIGLSFTACNMLYRSQSKKMELWLYLFIFASFTFAVAPRYAYQAYVQRNDLEYIREQRPEFLEKYTYRYNRNSADNLYLAEGVFRDLYLERGETITSNHADVTFQFQRENGEIMITIFSNPYEDLVLELPLYNYKGYTAELVNSAGQSFALTVSKSENGLVSVLAGNAKGTIRVAYGGTLCQKLSDLISVLTLFSLASYALWHTRASRRLIIS